MILIYRTIVSLRWHDNFFLQNDFREGYLKTERSIECQYLLNSYPILFTLHSATLLEMRLSSVMYYLYTPSTRLFPPSRKMNCLEYIHFEQILLAEGYQRKACQCFR